MGIFGWLFGRGRSETPATYTCAKCGKTAAEGYGMSREAKWEFVNKCPKCGKCYCGKCAERPAGRFWDYRCLDCSTEMESNFDVRADKHGQIVVKKK